MYLRKDALWLATFLNEILAFPAARHDDQVDDLSQFLARAGAPKPTVGLFDPKIVRAWPTPLRNSRQSTGLRA